MFVVPDAEEPEPLDDIFGAWGIEYVFVVLAWDEGEFGVVIMRVVVLNVDDWTTLGHSSKKAGQPTYLTNASQQLHQLLLWHVSWHILNIAIWCKAPTSVRTMSWWIIVNFIYCVAILLIFIIKNFLLEDMTFNM